MNTLISALETYFSGYNRVNEIILPSTNEINPNLVEDVIISVISDNLNDIRSATGNQYIDWYRMVRDAINSAGTQWISERGRFTRRLMRYLPILEPYAGTIGETITRRAAPLASTFRVSISAEIFWDDGNFGKKYSCWYGCFSESRYVFTHDAEGIALLFHENTYDAFNGIGRVWIAPIHERGNDILFLFNQYGTNYDGKDIRIEQSARILTHILPDTKSLDCNLENEYNDEIPYINGNCGIAVMPNACPIQRNYNFVVQWGDDDGYTCENCDERISHDDWHEVNGEYYCEDCFFDIFTSCDNCGEIITQDDSVYSDFTDRTYCQSCFDDTFIFCENCSEYRPRRYSENIDGSDYCYDCTGDLFTQCNQCWELIPNDDITEYNGDFFCQTCYDEITQPA